MNINHKNSSDSSESLDCQYYSQSPDAPDPNQLTTKTVISLSPEFNLKNEQKEKNPNSKYRNQRLVFNYHYLY